MRTQAKRKLPGKDRQEQAALIVAALGLIGVELRAKGLVGGSDTKNWPLVGYEFADPVEDAGECNSDEDEVQASSLDADDDMRRLPAAEPGDDEEFTAALHDLGQFILEQGDQGGPAVATATEQLQRAAEQGHTEAQFILGQVLCQGGPEDAAGARRLLQLAAEQGHTEAQLLIGEGEERSSVG